MNAPQLVTTLTTVLALALAIGMGAVLVRLLREERRRSAARIAALVEAASDPVAQPLPSTDEEIFRLKAEATGTQRAATAHATGTPRAVTAKAVRRTADGPEHEADAARDLDLRPTRDVAGISELFVEPERSSPWGRRIAFAALVAAIVSAAGYLLLSRDTTMADVSTAQAAVEQAPLELLSLGHTQQPDSLTITGLVQNPRTGVALSRVTATAMLFSPDGAFLASGRAALDFSTIRPGDESPFVVKVPVTGPVARYRVGFRGEDGRVIAHVDRRAGGTMALRN